MAGASDHVFHTILTIQSLTRHNVVLRSPKSQKAPISFVMSVRPSVRPTVSLRFPPVGSAWKLAVATFRKNLSRNFKLGSKRKTKSGSKQFTPKYIYPADSSHKIFYSSTKYFTAERNILQQYETFYNVTKFHIRTKYFTTIRNILQQCEIFYNVAKYFTTLRTILQPYEIFYSNTKYFTAVRNILQQYEIFYSSTKYFTAQQQYNGNQLLHFLGVTGNFCIVGSYIYLNNNT